MVKDACGVYATLLTLFQCVDPITCDQSMPVSTRSHFALLPDERNAFILLNHLSSATAHFFRLCVRVKHPRVLLRFITRIFTITLCVYFTSYFVSLIDTDTSSLRSPGILTYSPFLLAFHGVLFGLALFLQVFIILLSRLFLFLLHSYNLFVLLYKLLCKKIKHKKGNLV